jgi:hypothetical protein
MKRFDASVENLLRGKYGIAWCVKYKKYKEAYYTTSFTKWVFNNVHPVPYGKIINIVLLLGILEYEQHLTMENRYRHFHEFCKHIDTEILFKAIDAVRAEISKIQGGVG